MIATKPDDIKNLRIAGKLLGGILHELGALVRPGMSAAELDLFAERQIRAAGATPAFLNYKPEGAPYPYPAALCVSVNDEVVHGLPLETKVFAAGDLVMLDLGLSYNGYFADAAVSVCAGVCDIQTKKLLDATQEALALAIQAARVGGHVGDIGAAVGAVAKKYGLGVVEELGGHGVGKTVHEKPHIPNIGTAGDGQKLVEGMVLAIEPIFTVGSGDVYLDDDGWTYKTVDGARSAEFEHTILLTKNGPEVLTTEVL